jgi:CBS domain-containing protein
MDVKDAMTTPVATCHPESTLAAAGLEMLRHDCGFLPVVDPERGIVGVITDRDVCIAVSTRPQSAHDIAVGTVMSTNLLTVRPEDDLRHALSVMQHGRVHRVPVIDDQWQVVGILAVNDLVLFCGTEAGRHAGLTYDRIVEALKGITAHWRPHPLEELAMRHEREREPVHDFDWEE